MPADQLATYYVVWIAVFNVSPADTESVKALLA